MNEGETLRVNRILSVDALHMNPGRHVPGNGAAGPLQRSGTTSDGRFGNWWGVFPSLLMEASSCFHAL